MRKSTVRPAASGRGKRRLVECSNCLKRGNTRGAFLTFEQDNLGKYYLSAAECDHNTECTRDPEATAAERRAEGDLWIPEALHDLAEDTYRACPSTAWVDNILREKAERLGLEVTWNWNHLDTFLQRFDVPANGDARGLLDWLGQRHYLHGMNSYSDTDELGRLTKVFYECEEAKEHLRAAEGARIVLYDTTHGTNRYGMKLGCFTGVNQNGRTILLAVTLLTYEDTLSFKWAFDKFQEAFSLKPDVMFTDGDLAMAAALKVGLVAAGTVHLLCVWHLAENLTKHLWRLFPAKGTNPDLNADARKRFSQKFNDIMTKGREDDDGRSLDEWFNDEFDELIAIAVDTTGAPPTDINLEEEEEVACADALQEIEKGDGTEELVNLKAKRAGKRKGKSTRWLAWEWLKNLRAMRKKWARCYVMEILTLGVFSTSRAEAWHAAIKLYMLNRTRKLLALAKRVHQTRRNMYDKHEESMQRAVKRQRMESRKYPAIINELKGSLTSKAIDMLLAENAKQTSWRAKPVQGEQTFVVVGQNAKKFRVGTPGQLEAGKGVHASLTWCAARCNVNSGLPCSHMMCVYRVTNTESFVEGVVHDFWKRREKVGEDEPGEEEEAHYSTPQGSPNPKSNVDSDDESEGAATVTRQGYIRVPKKSERYPEIMQAAKEIAVEGRESHLLYETALAGIEELVTKLRTLNSEGRDVGRPPNSTGEALSSGIAEGVRNPQKRQRGAGRHATKRKGAK